MKWKKSVFFVVSVVTMCGLFAYQEMANTIPFETLDNRIPMEKTVKLGINSSLAGIDSNTTIKEKLIAWNGLNIGEAYTDIASVNMMHFANLFKNSKMEKVNEDTYKFTIKGHTYQFTHGSDKALVDGKEYPLVMFHYNTTDATVENVRNHNYPKGAEEAWQWIGENIQLVGYSYRYAFMRKYNPLTYNCSDIYIFNKNAMTVPVSFLSEFFIIGQTKSEAACCSEITMNIEDVGFANQYSLNSEYKMDLTSAPHTYKYKENFNKLPEWLRIEIYKKANEIEGNKKREELPFEMLFDIDSNSHLDEDKRNKLKALSDVDGSGLYAWFYDKGQNGVYTQQNSLSYKDVTELGLDFVITLTKNNKYAVNAYQPLIDSGVLPEDLLGDIFSIINTPFLPGTLDRQVLEFHSSNGETYKYFFARYSLSSTAIHFLKKDHPALADELLINYNVGSTSQSWSGTKWLASEQGRNLSLKGFREDFGLGVPLYNDFRKSIGLKSIDGWYDTETQFKAAYESGEIIQRMNELNIQKSF